MSLKRLGFKPEHVQPILDGTKRATSRWKDQHWRVGEKRAAVTGIFNACHSLKELLAKEAPEEKK